jgi:hypothetical protein
MRDARAGIENGQACFIMINIVPESSSKKLLQAVTDT